MVYDAGDLWWPPFHRLYEQLERVKLEPTSVPADTLKAALAEYEPWLARGVASFRPPNEASARALASETMLGVHGGKIMPVEAGLKAAAADVSAMLGLDEIQAYFLLRRWWVSSAASRATGTTGGLRAASEGVGGSTSLSPSQRYDIVQQYNQERHYLLKSIETLLYMGECECTRPPVCAAGLLRGRQAASCCVHAMQCACGCFSAPQQVDTWLHVTLA